MARTDKSLEPFLNEQIGDESIGIKVQPISEVGAGSNRAVVTVTDTAAQITIGAGKKNMEIYNQGDNDAYYGGSGVTTSTGIPIFAGQTKQFLKVQSDFNIYVIRAAGETAVLRIVEFE